MVFPYFATGYQTGMITILNQLPEALKRKNCDVKKIMFSIGTYGSQCDLKNDVIYVYTRKADLYSVRDATRALYNLASRVKKEALEGKYDIVHGHSGTSILYKFLGSNIPACITNHGIGFKIYHFYWKYGVTRNRRDFLPYLKYFPKKIFHPVMGRLLFSLTDRVTTVSNFTKQEVSKIYGVPKEKIDVVPNGVPIDIFTPNIPKEQKDEIMDRYSFEKALLFISPAPIKGLHLLIKALQIVSKVFTNTKLLVIGAIPSSDTYYKFCYELIKKLNVKKKVVFLGKIDYTDLPKYYSVASTYVLPTSYDNCPFTVLESMACGTAVCASRVGGLPEIISHGKDGLLFDPTNINSIANAIITILNDEALQRRLGFNARKKVEQRYSWDEVANQYIEVYQKTITKRNN
jgi:glycosyltransferase involved in cell wall biosynthesis